MFWDFDGVIKETVEVKSEAFADLFRGYGQCLMNKIREHHKLHGGISRLEKIPLYLNWAGLAPDSENIRRLSERFSQMVFQKVVEAPWVPGAKELLHLNPFQQKSYLVTATPQPEIELILAALNLTSVFQGVFGAPVPKTDAMQKVLEVSGMPKELCLLIGDSLSDRQAAMSMNIPFLLREHSDNSDLGNVLSTPRIANFLSL